MSQHKQKIILGLLSGGLAGALLVLTLLYTPTPKVQNFSHILPPDAYVDVVLQAKAAFVYKPLTREVLFSKNAESQLPLASITKVMSAIIVKENLTPDTKITFEENNWRLSDLLNYTLMVSSNEATQALAAAASAEVVPHTAVGGATSLLNFTDKMNKKAKDLNLAQTYFLDVAGLDPSDTQSGAYGSARDVAHLFAHALKVIPEAMEATTIVDTWFYSATGTHPAINTNEAIGAIPGLIAGKTGFTDLAGGNLVVAFDPGFNDPTIAVVLGSSKDGRFEDIKKLVRASLTVQDISFTE